MAKSRFLHSLLIGILICSINFCSSDSANTDESKKSVQQPQKKEIALADIKYAVFNRDLNKPAESDLKSLNFGAKLLDGKPVLLDSQKKLRLTFLINDKKSNAPITVHQAFVLLMSDRSGREIVFVAEPDRTTKAYTFDLDLKVHGKDFDGLGGSYSARLVLGDQLVSNPIDWNFGELSLTLSSQHTPPNVPKSSRVNYDVLPEIKHAFRAPEPRPPVIVSDAFAVICAAPMLLMFILWFRIGLNLGNLKCSLWALGFHLGLCAIFGLYACYWLKLDMFQTLKWLAIVGTPTLLCGNRLLHSFSVPKKQKPE